MIYKFTNVNPLGKIEEDCVCRAISNALNLDYYYTQDKLFLVGKLFDCECLCVCCYSYLLDYVFQLKRDESWKGCTIADFIHENKRGTYLIRIDGHLTCVKNGVIEDLWDCSQKIIDIIWCVY